MKSFAALLFLFLATFDMAPGFALSPGQRVDNFRLLDHEGASHELYYLSDMKAVVIMTQGNGCPIVRKALPELKAIRERYATQGVSFLLLNSNLQDDRAAVAQEAAQFAIDFPVLLDTTQLIGESLGVERTAEVLLIDTKTWKLIYRGPIDDRLHYEAQKPAATKPYLASALDALLAGRPVSDSVVDAPGCLINFPERDNRAAHKQISYSETIAPMLIDKCMSCHRAGGIAPWAMSDYSKVRGFAPMMREVLRTQRMPPWNADPHFGSFIGDRSLTTAQVQTLVHWIEAGAPRGEGGDPLVSASQRPWSEWTLGKPDLIVEVPAYEVPASGTVSYQYPTARNPLERDVWIRAIEIQPGDRSVVHHVLAGIGDPKRPQFVGSIGELGGYAPGKNAAPYPEDTGILLRKDAHFRFQMHYTPNGRAVTDVTRIGLYFHDTPPRHELKMSLIFDTRLTIPANAKSHSESLEHEFDRDVMLYSLLPHAHLRGKAARYTAFYPDGQQEILLSVPKLDFNWQTTYFFKTPKLLPRGTKVRLDMTWDNSAQNPRNPDPGQVVRWGDQTWEEMNVGWLRYRDAVDADRGVALSGVVR